LALLPPRSGTTITGITITTTTTAIIPIDGVITTPITIERGTITIIIITAGTGRGFGGLLGSESAMPLDAAKYEAVARLRGSRQFQIRALRPGDEKALLAAAAQTSAQSLYRRFFSLKRGFTEDEVNYFVNVDFVGHVALVATLAEGSQGGIIIGSGRYVVVEPGKAEMAFVVIDRYQGQGVGTALLRHLAAIARDAGLRELTAQVLADNLSMLRVFEKSGLLLRTTREGEVVHVVLGL
jgi:GNAT superfamily N-acetyltransferase